MSTPSSMWSSAPPAPAKYVRITEIHPQDDCPAHKVGDVVPAYRVVSCPWARSRKGTFEVSPEYVRIVDENSEFDTIARVVPISDDTARTALAVQEALAYKDPRPDVPEPSDEYPSDRVAAVLAAELQVVVNQAVVDAIAPESPPFGGVLDKSELFESSYPPPSAQADAARAAFIAAARADKPATVAPPRKETNPKQPVANDHVKFSAVPLRVLAGVAVAMSEGAWKYRRHNYRVAGVCASVYFDATMDHLLAWFEGQDIDPDSGRHHIDKAIASLFVLRDAMLGGVVTDDRPPAVPNDWVKEAHADTKVLHDRMRGTHGESKEPYTIGGDRVPPERGGK